MISRDDLEDYVFEAVKTNGGRATIVEIAKYIWSHHESDLKQSGDLFYTWQYDMRWAAQRLRDNGKFKNVTSGKRGIWELA